eukprot:g8178.t1
MEWDTGSRDFDRGRTLSDVWKAISEWCAEPFKVCRARLGSVDRNYDYDEEDMTWVEYQWLARTSDDSPRMKRPPPRLSRCLTPSKITSDDDDEGEITERTPPVTPPIHEVSSNSCAVPTA